MAGAAAKDANNGRDFRRILDQQQMGHVFVSPISGPSLVPAAAGESPNPAARNELVTGPLPLPPPHRRPSAAAPSSPPPAGENRCAPEASPPGPRTCRSTPTPSTPGA